MRKVIFILAVLLLVACEPRIYNSQEALLQIFDLDAEYNTAMKEERINKLLLSVESMESYLEDLDELKERVATNNEDERETISLLFQIREEMLMSQILFQKGYFGVGENGRVSDGFGCEDIDDIRTETSLLENAWHHGITATQLIDEVLARDEVMKQALGVGENKMEFYSSDFAAIHIEIQSNVVAMYRFCNTLVQTKYLDFTERLKKEDEVSNEDESS